MRTLFVSIIFVSLFPFAACSKNATATESYAYFDTLPVVKPLVPLISEASGIADSRNFPGHIWVQEDSGAPNALYLIDREGRTVKMVGIKNAVNRDWEDMVLAGGRIYIGEIGDNAQTAGEYSILHFPEPVAGTDTVNSFETIRFVYPDGPHDAEAFLVDPATKDIYVISKRTNPSIVYKIAFPYNNGLQTATEAARLGYAGVVSAALAPDGRSILVKTYSSVQRYPRKSGQSISDALMQTPEKVYYKMEPQGEAIGFALDGSGFFTLSEKGFSNGVSLYFYPARK